MIKANLIESNIYHPQAIIRDILNIIPYNNRYAKSYLKLSKLISDDYHVKEVTNIPYKSNFLFYKEYGIKLDKSDNFETIKSENLDILSEDTIYKAIMDNNKELFISYTERKGFDENQQLRSSLFSNINENYSLLKLCCYYGAVHCFKFLRTEFHSEITQRCLELSFLGGNQEIMNECLKYHKPNYECMRFAIISHNIDFVTFLMNEYNIEINLEFCTKYKNLESFLVCLDQASKINECFVYSTYFEIPSLCENILSIGADINRKVFPGETALHIAAKNNSKEIAELLISHGANINEKDVFGQTALYNVACYNSKETAELLISYGANINEKTTNGKTALHTAVFHNCKETAELLISHGANINEKDMHGKSALHYASKSNNKETAKLLLAHDANINEKDIFGQTALNDAASYNRKETTELLISLGANINEKSKNGETALHCAAKSNSKETAEFLFLMV